MHKLIKDINITETEDGFRIEITGDKERMKAMGFGTHMAEKWKARAERGWGHSHAHGHGHKRGWRGKRKRMMRGMPPFMGFGFMDRGEDDHSSHQEPKDYV